MKTLSYVISTLLIGFLVQFVFTRYLTSFGVGPQLLLLLVVAHGFLLGPVMGQTMGFFWGLMMDCLGANFFGMQSLLFSVAGFTAGALRRRVASERPTAQLVIGLVVALYYGFGAHFVKTTLVQIQEPLLWSAFMMGIIFNVVLVTGLFWVAETWITLWQLERENAA